LSKSSVTAAALIACFLLCTGRLLCKRSTFSINGVHWYFISWTYRGDFVDPVVKMNGSYYWNSLLRQHPSPAIRSISGPFFMFQQETHHRACKTIALQLSADTRSVCVTVYSLISE